RVAAVDQADVGHPPADLRAEHLGLYGVIGSTGQRDVAVGPGEGGVGVGVYLAEHGLAGRQFGDSELRLHVDPATRCRAWGDLLEVLSVRKLGGNANPGSARHLAELRFDVPLLAR